MSRAAAARASDAPDDASALPGSIGDVQQFVIFHVKNEMFAVPLGEVQEIIRMPKVVRMPLAPGALEGLANLRGSVLPVINLRKVFNFEQVAHDDTTRVVVLDHGRPIGLVVDRMANVVTVESSSIESATTLKTTVDSELVVGMIKPRAGSPMVMILDAANLIRRQFQDVAGEKTEQVRSAEISLDSRAGPGAVEGAIDENQLVSFVVDEQEYAFPIEQVQEIVQLPSRITQVPNAPEHVLGVITLRNRLLPLVSLRHMFGLSASEISEANKVVVVSLDEGQGASVGVVMDSIREVLRVPRSSIDAMPSLLAKGRSLDDIQSICKLDEGRRLVSVLSASRMFNSSELQNLVQQAEKGEAMVNVDAQSAAQVQTLDDEEQFVVFWLMEEEYGVPIESVQEIVRVPDELTHVPKTPDFIEGVINLRGSVLPVVDQRRRFGLPAIERNDRQRIMVFTIGGVRTGFIVDSVSEVMRIGAKFIGKAPRLSKEQQKLIRRVANLEAHQRMILLLDVEQLLDVAELDAVRDEAGEP